MKEWTFPDIREQERLAREQHAAFCANLRAAISIADGLLQIQTSGGYKHLQQAFEDMLKHRTSALLSAREDREAAVLQGRCAELRAILALVVSTQENKQALARSLKDAEDSFRELERTFKPLPPPETKT